MSNDECLINDEARMTKNLHAQFRNPKANSIGDRYPRDAARGLSPHDPLSSILHPYPLPSPALIQRCLGKDHVHQHVMSLRRNLGEQLTLERQCHEGRISTGVLEQLVVIAFA